MLLPFLSLILFFSNLKFCELRKSEENSTDFEKHENWGLLPHGKCGLQPRFSRDTCGGLESPNLWSTKYGPANNNDVPAGQFPWLATVYRKAHGSYPICTGNIISAKYVIITNLCVRNERSKLPMLWVRLGERYVNRKCPASENETCAMFTETIKVESIVNGAKASASGTGVALLRLVVPIQYNEFIQPICLPIYGSTINMHLEDIEMEIAGWRHYETPTDKFTYQGNLKSRRKRGVKCPSYYSNYICVGNFSDEYPTFTGGRGSPIMKAVPRQGCSERVYHIFGIYELVSEYKYAKKPFKYVGSLYLRISKYVKWILNNIKP